MLNASQVARGSHRLLSRLGSAEDLEATAKASGALLRCREIKSAGDLLRLALAYGPCGMSLRTAAAWAETIGVGSLSDVAVMKRLQASADWLQEVSGQAKRLKRLGKAHRAEWRAIVHTPDGKTVPVRILVRRKPPDAIEREIKRIKEKAARRGRTRRSGKPDPRSLIAAQYTIVAASLDEPAEQIFDLYSLRWQIEIAFKRLKSILHIDQLQAKHPDLARTWLLAHIIAALLIEDHAAEALDSPPSALRYAASAAATL